MARPSAALGLLLAALAGLACGQLAEKRFEVQLLAQKRAIVNWAEFAKQNDIKGWEDEWEAPYATDVCDWTGVRCSSYDLTVDKLDLACSFEGGPFCKVRAAGTLAPELANITTLVELALNGQNLNGTLPAAWGSPAAFPELKTLSLYENKFRGTLPASWGVDGAWPELQKLDLKNNKLDGTLPSEWGVQGAFPKLTTIYLDSNEKLTGTLPTAWANATAWRSLDTLSISSANLKGSLPLEWASPQAFPKLSNLILFFNFLNGTLPVAWGSNTSFPALRSLELSVNGLTGTLPPEWGTSGGFKSLAQLSLDSNFLRGTLPAAWALPEAFPKLKGLALNNNTELCGAVPPALFSEVCEAPPPSGTDCFGPALPACTASFPPASPADVAALLSLRRSISNWDAYSKSNKIMGWNDPLPVCEWTGVTCSDQGAILAIDLSCPYTEADFADEVPLKYEDSPFIIDGLTPCGVKARGTLPAEVASISTLQIVNLYNQNLTGTLPAAWGATGAFANLTEIDLTNNQLSGTLPDGWATDGAFPVLSTLRLERNNLNGTLPLSWANKREAYTPFITLRSLYLRSNALTGPLPPEWSGNFRLLSYLDLGNNSLSGTLPDSWGTNTSFQKLTELYLNNQKNLRGPLPAAWGSNGSFPALWQLDVNNNKLTGPLPESWGSGNLSFRSIGSLEMNNNQFTGTLPSVWGKNDTFQNLGTLELRNSRLTGGIPAEWEAPTALPNLITLALAGNEGLCGPIPARLSSATCEDPTATTCTADKSQIDCGLTPPPSPPSPPSSSSVPIGAIVGGVVGGLVVIAALAFFALRPRKGWLRRQAPVDAKEPESGRSSSLVHSGQPKHDYDDDDFPLSKLAPAVDPKLFSVVPPSSTEFDDDESLPFSYITTGGLRSGNDRRAPRGSNTTPSFNTPSLSAAGRTLETDPVLTFISTRLATMQGTQRSGSSSSLLRSRSSYSSLPAEVRQWAVRWEAIQLERMIGRGSFGRVYLAVWNATPVAVKVLINADGTEPTQDLELPAEIMKQLQEEAVVMSRMRHPNIVSFMGICTLPACILTEYCSRGSLYDVLRLAGSVPQLSEQLTWALRLRMAFDAARGLLYLHDRTPPIIHHDVKSPNLLVDEHWRVKVCDFNLSEIMRYQGGNDPEAEGATNPIWLAPEVLEGHRATQASDVYSYGLVLWELLTWQLPWRPKQPFQVRRAVLDGQRPPIPSPEDLPGPDSASAEGLDAYLELMSDCWHQDPRQRPSFVDVVSRLQGLIGEHDPPRIDSRDSRGHHS